ncbi:MAG TPA: hypothetical protein VEZ51_00520, partial [Gemmatimonadaceae bacterium]|nr:hypothetical protein [Gemmatimonadaceae bacterium]
YPGPMPPLDPDGFTNVLDEDILIRTHANHGLELLDRVVIAGNIPTLVNGTFYVVEIPTNKTLKVSITRDGVPILGDGDPYVTSGTISRGISNAMIATGSLANTPYDQGKTCVMLQGLFRDLAVSPLDTTDGSPIYGVSLPMMNIGTSAVDGLDSNAKPVCHAPYVSIAIHDDSESLIAGLLWDSFVELRVQPFAAASYVGSDVFMNWLEYNAVLRLMESSLWFKAS